MFGFSLTKLLVLVVVVAAVLVVFRMLSQRDIASRRSPESDKPGKAVDTEYDEESDTYVVRRDKTGEK